MNEWMKWFYSHQRGIEENQPNYRKLLGFGFLNVGPKFQKPHEIDRRKLMPEEACWLLLLVLFSKCAEVEPPNRRTGSFWRMFDEWRSTVSTCIVWRFVGWFMEEFHTINCHEPCHGVVNRFQPFTNVLNVFCLIDTRAHMLWNGYFRTIRVSFHLNRCQASHKRLIWKILTWSGVLIGIWHCQCLLQSSQRFLPFKRRSTPWLRCEVTWLTGIRFW